MTVAQLIDHLKTIDPGMPVWAECFHDDYDHNTEPAPVCCVNVESVFTSAGSVLALVLREYE